MGYQAKDTSDPVVLDAVDMIVECLSKGVDGVIAELVDDGYSLLASWPVEADRTCATRFDLTSDREVLKRRIRWAVESAR